jgi:hypothetical protein
MGVPSKMLYFPDEGHWVLKPQNSQLWYKTVNDWVDRWTGTRGWSFRIAGYRLLQNYGGQVLHLKLRADGPAVTAMNTSHGPTFPAEGTMDARPF